MFTYEQLQQLNTLEMAVYNYVVEHRQAVTKMKIRQLADNAHVSTTTVLNFCNKIGCQGYAEFKVKLKLLLSEQAQRNISEDTKAMQSFFEKIDTVEFQLQINKVATMVAEAQVIYIFGIGNSGIIGQYAARYFSNLGLFAIAITDPSYPLPQLHQQEAVVLAFSVSGETDIVVRAVHTFKQEQAKIISITNSLSSTLAKLSDLSIVYAMPIETIGPFYDITTQVPTLHIIESIARKAAEKRLGE